MRTPIRLLQFTFAALMLSVFLGACSDDGVLRVVNIEIEVEGTYKLDDRSLSVQELEDELRALRELGEKFDLRIYETASSKYEHSAYAVKAAMDAGVKNIVVVSEPPAGSPASDPIDKRPQ